MTEPPCGWTKISKRERRIRVPSTASSTRRPCVLVLWSTDSVSRPFVTDEARRGHNRGVLLPVLLGAEVRYEDVPLGLGEIQSVRLEMPEGLLTEADLEQLNKAVKERIESPAATDPLLQARTDIREKLIEHLKDRYEIVNLLGRGGSSAVFRATSATAMSVPYAIKVTTIHNLLLNEGLYETLIAASATAYKLRHPNIAAVHNVEQRGDLLVSVMRFVDGRSVRSILRDEGLEPGEAQSILVQVADALA